MITACAVRGLRSSGLPRSSIFTHYAAPSQPLRVEKVTQSKHFRSYATASTSSSTHSKARNSRVNPPVSTLPPPLELPTREPNQSTIKYLFKQGKAYLTFYKTGAQAIFTNLNLTREPQKLVDLTYDGKLYLAVKDKERRLSRGDYQLILRHWHDLKRLPIFGLIFLVCGEFTPLVVIAVSSVVPYTCRVPAQIASDRQKLEERRKISFRNLTSQYKEGIELDRQQLLHISWSLGLSSKMWDYLGGQLPGLPNAILKRKVSKAVEYIETDDYLLRRDGGVAELEGEEVRIACQERGIDVVGREEEELRNVLEKWLATTKNAGATKLLLMRPNVWTVAAPKPSTVASKKAASKPGVAASRNA